MSLYKILEEVPGVRRFQLVQTAPERFELRLAAQTEENIAGAFERAGRELTAFFDRKGVSGVEIVYSEKPPQANRVSGKFKHICREFEQ